MPKDKASFAFGGIPRTHLRGVRMHTLPANAERDYYSVAQAADAMNICTRTLRRMIDCGVVNVRHVGRYVLVKKSVVARLVK